MFARYPVVCLQETRSVHGDPLLGWLEATHVPFVARPPEALHGRAGSGLATYVQRQYRSGARAVPHPSGLVLGLTLKVNRAALHVFNVYRPPSKPFADLLDAVDDCMRICGVQPGHGVLVCGDFNAHLPAADDRPVGPDGLLQGAFPARVPTPGPANAAGGDLVDWCRASGFVLLTGRLQDGPGQAASSSTRGNTRCDHCLVSVPTYGWVQEHRVLAVEGSDHKPLHTVLRCPRGQGQAGAPVPGLLPLPRRILWAPSKAEAFEEALESNPAVTPHLEGCAAACEAADAASAVHALHEALYAAADGARMRCGRPRPSGTGRHRRHQPWFDDECAAARIAMQGYGRQPPPGVLKQYEALLRRKKRRHGRVLHQRFLELDRKDRRWFWQQVRAPRAPSLCPDPAATSAHFALVFGGPSPSPVQGPARLSALDTATDVIYDEAVCAAVKAVRSWSAPGAPGVPAQAFKCLGLRGLVEEVLRCVYASHSEPAAVKEGLLCPIYKQRGSPLEPVNYRPIVVSSVLHKIYAHCLLRALRKHLEGLSGTLFPRQAGFMPGRNTLLNVLALHHMVSFQAAQRQSLHVVLLDVSKAYDSVQLPTLVSTLSSLLVPPPLVAAIVGMYAGLEYRLRLSTGLGPAFPVGIGVKQGCPLSPFLFNLYVAGLSQHLAETVPACGFPLGGAAGEPPQRVPDFHYADDDLLADPCSSSLQGGIDATVAYYAPRNLHLNVPKCVALQFNPQWGEAPPQPLSAGGVPFPLGPPEGSLYLGVMCDQQLSPASMADHRSRCFVSTFAAVMSNLRAAVSCVPASPPVVLRLLHMVAEPAGLYGCEVWGLMGVRVVAGSDDPAALYTLSDPLERQRCIALRRHFRIPHHVPKLALLHELGCVPLVHQYVLRAVGLYNRMRAAGASYEAILQQHVRHGLTGPIGRGEGTWIKALFDVLRLLLPRGGWQRKFLALDPVSVKEVAAALRVSYATHTHSFRSVYSGAGSRVGFYFREVGDHTVGTLPHYLSAGCSRDSIRACLRFRLGCHFLRVQTGRLVGLPRPRRRCQRCPVPQVDDEQHCLFDCQHPDLLRARSAFVSSVSSGHVPMSLQQIFQAAALDRRQLRLAVRFVAECYHIAEACNRAQQAGAAPPVGLHPVLALLPADEIDLFDSASDSSLPVDDHLDSLNSSRTSSSELVEVQS